jgi:hypothetical protein
MPKFSPENCPDFQLRSPPGRLNTAKFAETMALMAFGSSTAEMSSGVPTLNRRAAPSV